MHTTIKSLFIAALIAGSSTAYAQETAPAEEETPPAAEQTPETEQAPETETPEAETPAEDGSNPGSDLNLGESTGPQTGQPYILEEFGDWAMRCIKAEEGQPDPCQLYQLLKDGEGNDVAEVSMFRLPEGGEAVAGATIVVPLETLLTQQLTIAVDGANERRYPFTFCNRAGCVARVGFTANDIAQFRRGNAATLRLVPAAAPADEVVLNMSLTGFTAGYEGVVTPNNQ